MHPGQLRWLKRNDYKVLQVYEERRVPDGLPTKYQTDWFDVKEVEAEIEEKINLVQLITELAESLKAFAGDEENNTYSKLVRKAYRFLEFK